MASLTAQSRAEGIDPVGPEDVSFGLLIMQVLEAAPEAEMSEPLGYVHPDQGLLLRTHLVHRAQDSGHPRQRRHRCRR